MRKFVSWLVVCCALLAFPLQGLAASNENSDYHLVIDQKPIAPDQPIYMVNDRLFAPVRLIAEQFGAQVDWNEPHQTIDILTPDGEHLLFTIDRYTMELNGKSYILDACPFTENDTTYLPLRDIAQLLNERVVWDNDARTASFSPAPLYEVSEDETWESIGDKLDISTEWLKEWNGGELPEAGQPLKVAIPDVIKDKKANEDMYLLARIIDVEAGYEPMKGQIAVGNVVLNRVKDSRFPDTIHDVIFAPHQFPPALDGKLDGLIPHKTAVEAAQRALNGENYVKDAVYFYNAARESSSFFQSLTTIKDIGSHRFAK